MALAIEAGFPVHTYTAAGQSSWTKTITTTKASLILLVFSGHGPSNNFPLTGVSGATLGAFTKITGASGNRTSLSIGGEFWYKVSSGPVTNEVITINATAACDMTDFVLYSVIGAAAAPIGGSATTGTSTNLDSVTISALAVGSFVFVQISNYASATALTANANNTPFDEHNEDAGNTNVHAAGHAITSALGNITVGATDALTNSFVNGVEILAAAATTSVVFCKPGLVPRIRRVHTLARDLVWCCLPEHGELVRTRFGVPSLTTIATTLVGKACHNANTPGTTGGMEFTPGTSHPIYGATTNVTLVVYANLVSAGNIMSVVAMPDPITLQNNLGLNTLGILPAGGMFAYQDNAGLEQDVSTVGNFFLATDGWTCYAAERDTITGFVNFYKNGILFESLADTSVLPISYVNSPSFVLTGFSTTQGNITGDVALVYVFNRPLSTYEHRMLTEYPLDLLDFGILPEDLILRVDGAAQVTARLMALLGVGS